LFAAATGPASIGFGTAKKRGARRTSGPAQSRLTGRREFFICQRLAAPSIVAARRIRGGAGSALTSNARLKSDGDELGMRVSSNAVTAGVAAVVAALIAPRARAQVFGGPKSGEIGFLPTVTQNGDDIVWMHNWILLPVTIGISLLVLGLIVYIVYNFNETANPTPSRRTHNGLLEFAWTVAPALVLVVIAVPSFRLLADQLIIPAPDLTLKVTASQWHWNYGYPKSEGGFSFDSLYVEEKDLKPGQPPVITADHEMVVPVNKVIELDVVSQDVIHSFSVPSFGIKIDAIPGRLNKTWFKAEQVGFFYGQCSNICGIDHAFMPINVRVLSQSDYDAWLVSAKKQFAVLDRVDVAAAPRVQP
jgi:cytochrome c oxidase subunit 2